VIKRLESFAIQIRWVSRSGTGFIATVPNDRLNMFEQQEAMRLRLCLGDLMSGSGHFKQASKARLSLHRLGSPVKFQGFVSDSSLGIFTVPESGYGHCTSRQRRIADIRLIGSNGTKWIHLIINCRNDIPLEVTNCRVLHLCS
jgi:hypothetical protein